jgi:hypothetical protein
MSRQKFAPSIFWSFSGSGHDLLCFEAINSISQMVFESLAKEHE